MKRILALVTVFALVSCGASKVEPLTVSPTIGVAPVVTPVATVEVILTPKNYRPYLEMDVKEHALSEWGDNYSMVKFTIDREVKAWVSIKDYVFKDDTERVLYKNAVYDWYPQYTMIKFEFERQVKAYNEVGGTLITK